MEQYKLRITLNKPESREQCLHLQKKYFTSFIKAEEVGKTTGKSHFHYYIQTTTKPQNIRQYIARNIGSGNGAFSLSHFKELLPDFPIQYCSYLLKDCDEPEFNNIDPDLEAQIRAYSKEVNKQVRASRRGGKVDILRTKILELPNCTSIPTHIPQLIYCICQVYLNEGWTFSKYRIAEYTQTILFQESTDYRNKMYLSIQDLVEK